jgi:F-type H+-transporting ATPase subunit delta
MAELSTLARPYAEAAFKRAKQTANTAEWTASLQFLSVLGEDQSLKAIAGNPRVSKESITTLLLEICEGNVLAEAINLLKLLVENGRLTLLATITRMFEELKAQDEGYVNVDLYSAYPLTKAELSKYTVMLEKQLHKKVNTTVTVDKSLIGGILAKAGDKVIDGSIRSQIHQLAKRL